MNSKGSQARGGSIECWLEGGSKHQHKVSAPYQRTCKPYSGSTRPAWRPSGWGVLDPMRATCLPSQTMARGRAPCDSDHILG